MSKKVFIAWGSNPKEGGGGYGIDVYVIYADDIEEAMSLCPLPTDEVSIEQIYTNRKNSRCKKICDYYE